LTEHSSIQSVKPVKVTTLIESAKLPTPQEGSPVNLSVNKTKDTSPFAEMSESSHAKTNLISTITRSPTENDLIQSPQHQSGRRASDADPNVDVTMNDPQYLDEIMSSGGVRRKILELEELQNISKVGEGATLSIASPQKHTTVKHFAHGLKEKVSTSLEALPFAVRSRESKKRDVNLPILEEQIFNAIDVELMRLTPSEPPTEIIKLSPTEDLETRAKNMENIEEVVCEKICHKRKSFDVATEDVLLKLETKEFEEARQTCDDETESIMKVKDVVQSFERRYPLSSAQPPSFESIKIETKPIDTPDTPVSPASRSETNTDITEINRSSSTTDSIVGKTHETVYIESKISKIAKMFEGDLDRNKTQEFIRDNIYETEFKDNTGTHKTDDIVEPCQLATISSRTQVCDTKEQYFTNKPTKMTNSDNIDKHIWDNSTVRGKVMQYEEKWEFPKSLETTTNAKKTINITMVTERPADQSFMTLESINTSSVIDHSAGQPEIEDGSSSSSQFHTPSEITPPDIRLEQFGRKYRPEISFTAIANLDLDHSSDDEREDSLIERKKEDVAIPEATQITQISELMDTKLTGILSTNDKEAFESKPKKFSDKSDSELISPKKSRELFKDKGADRQSVSKSVEVLSLGQEPISKFELQRLIDKSDEDHVRETIHIERITVLPTKKIYLPQAQHTESSDKRISTEKLRQPIKGKYLDEVIITKNEESSAIEDKDFLHENSLDKRDKLDLKSKSLVPCQVVRSTRKSDSTLRSEIEINKCIERKDKKIIIDTKPLDKLIDTKLTDALQPDHEGILKTEALDKLDSKLSSPVLLKKSLEKEHADKLISVTTANALPSVYEDIPPPSKTLEKKHLDTLVDVKLTDTLQPDYAVILETKSLHEFVSELSSSVELKKSPEKEHPDISLDVKAIVALPPEYEKCLLGKSAKSLDKAHPKFSPPGYKNTPKKEHPEMLLDPKLADAAQPDHSKILKTKPLDTLDSKLSSQVEPKKYVKKNN
uniref:Uncharacterized protein n=1 Tax=Glossina morsitans morsitans TaxID=37546 RepID=A0A1B0G5D4_GLOMM